MRIAKIIIPEKETSQVKLKEINLTKKPLGSVVALVGKNGAGKSRILNFVETYAKTITLDKYFDSHIVNIPNSINSQFSTQLQQLKNQYSKLSKSNQLNQQTHSQLNHQFSGFLQKYQQLSPAYIKLVDNDDLKIIKDKLNSNLTFENIISNDFQNILSNPTLLQQQLANPKSSSLLINEFTALNNQTTVSYIKKLTNEILAEEINLYLKNRSDTSVITDLIKKNKSFQLFDSFQKYVQKFLGKEFSYSQITQGNTVNSTLHLNSEPFDINLLSPGQKMLFAYALLFFYLDANSKTNLRESIIIIDEPEKHLHPEAQIQLIDALKDIVGKTGQLWIATHSIHILSHLDYDEILMIKDDSIILPSRTTPGNSFNELMGIENHIIELTNFINSISEWAYGNFMVQCLKNPDIIFENNPNDPQFKLFKEFITDKSELSLLDFGAGKGRIGYTISDDSETAKKVTYSAYEPDKNNYDLLSKTPNIKALFSLPEEINSNTFDLVILCNVLHEINPKEWVETLGLAKNSLKEDGYLIILEDRYLPKGETAHEFGYIILGSDETQIMLNSKNPIELKLSEEQFSNRIIFNAFLKNDINPTNESIKSAIKKLQVNALNNIRLLKKQKKDLNQGRRLANETQLYINSQLFLDSVKTK